MSHLRPFELPDMGLYTWSKLSRNDRIENDDDVAKEQAKQSDTEESLPAMSWISFSLMSSCLLWPGYCSAAAY